MLVSGRVNKIAEPFPPQKKQAAFFEMAMRLEN